MSIKIFSILFFLLNTSRVFIWFNNSKIFLYSSIINSGKFKQQDSLFKKENYTFDIEENFDILLFFTNDISTTKT